MSADAEQRLMDLEMRFAFQEDTIQSLNDTVAAQAAAMEKLQLGLQRLNEQVKRLHPGEGSAAGEHEPPPHY